jgi:hypothetical protein
MATREPSDPLGRTRHDRTSGDATPAQGVLAALHQALLVERTIAWLQSFRRVITRFERHIDIDDGFDCLA